METFGSVQIRFTQRLTTILKKLQCLVFEIEIFDDLFEIKKEIDKLSLAEMNNWQIMWRELEYVQCFQKFYEKENSLL